jgi:hypothetical protein
MRLHSDQPTDSALTWRVTVSREGAEMPQLNHPIMWVKDERRSTKALADMIIARPDGSGS